MDNRGTDPARKGFWYNSAMRANQWLKSLAVNNSGMRPMPLASTPRLP